MTQTPTDALRLVLVEPTEAMLDVGKNSILEARAYSANDRESARAIWAQMLAAAPASPLPGGGWPVHIVRANGATVEDQRRAVLKGETYKQGDMVLAWVSEGDLYGNPAVKLETLPAAPTGEPK